ncbi:MAG: hypothetical protein P4L49_11095 [Desulfosporosinus sp.]|nr:hypothetical protein [Desulfosporosinus sp.]
MVELLSRHETGVQESIFEESLTSKYAENDIIHSLVQMIPIVKPIIDGVMSMPGNKYKDKRVSDFLLLLYLSLKVSEKQMAKSEFEDNIRWAKTEAFYDMFNLAIEGAVKSRSREKLIMNVMILSNLFSVKNNGEFCPEEYIYALGQLSPLEVKIISVFYQSYKTDVEPSDSESELQKANRLDAQGRLISELGIYSENLLFLLKRIEKLGFIKELKGSLGGYSGGRFTITESLSRMMDYLAEHPLAAMVI